MSTKYIFITGGVISSLGKGIVAASLGALLECRGLKLTVLKMDPYINVDPGTMSPFQHGEVFVTDDGAETDLDLGHYERFTSRSMNRLHNFTTGQVYESVIDRERRGDYLGGTVQVIPHITDEIKRRIRALADDNDVVITEVGGTVGDIEGLPFLEAIRQMRSEEGRDNVIYLHLTLVPFIRTADELKTKPTQHSVKELREIGIQPDVILCRCDRPLPQATKDKIALFGNVPANAVITNQDVEYLYEVPLRLHEEGLDERIVELLRLPAVEPDISFWEDLIEKLRRPRNSVNIGVVGKYVNLVDSYKSLHEALVHGGIGNDCKVNIHYINSEALEDGQNGVADLLADADGILVPGGFGDRGIEGMIKAIEYARVNGIPYFGICLGLQLAVVEFSRHVCSLAGANSYEFSDDTPHPVVALMGKQKDVDRMGGTMRLGEYPCDLVDASLARAIYGEKTIRERHRHRWEVNNEYRPMLEERGFKVSGLYTSENLVEMMELKEHPWFLGCQFHPELKSTPRRPHPLFRDFVRASLQNAERKNG